MLKRIFIIFVIISFVIFSIFVFSAIHAHQERSKEQKKYSLNKNIKVEILNGTNVPDLARRLTYVMRKDSFDVLVYGTSRTKLPKTIVVERNDSSMRYANHIASWYGIKEKTIEIDVDHIIDVTLIIGRDYKKIFPYLDTLKAMY